MTLDRLNLIVTDVRCEARDVLWLELRSPTGQCLPPFTAGSHLELRLPGGLTRYYSICNDPGETDRYCVAVGRAVDSRGGSRHIHHAVRVGTQLDCSVPRNNFPLDLSANDFVFVAGGIGITPILSMIRACEAAGKRWTLHYAARNRQRMAFYEELSQSCPDQCNFHFDDEAAGRHFDAAAALSGMPDDAHLYCCGPTPLMKAVEQVSEGRAPGHAHFEWFTAEPKATTNDQPFTIFLRQSDKRFEVPPGKSILEVLEANGEGVPCSCREGLCATCKTPVLSGVPDHRDSVLSAAERAANDQIILCVSRARSELLELDL